MTNLPVLFSSFLATFAIGGLSTAAAAQVQFGTGCPVNNTVPVIDMQGDPRVGNEIHFEVLQVPANSLTFLLVGLSNTMFSGQPLPLALGPWLHPNNTCRLLVSADTVALEPASGSGVAARDFFIPQAPALIGLSLFAQWGVFANAAPGGLAMTPALSIDVARSCWYCGDYTSLTNLQDVRRICSPNWLTCPSTTSLQDGFSGTLNSGTCRCDG